MAIVLFAVCGLAEMSTGELMGIATTNVENRCSVICIAAADKKDSGNPPMSAAVMS